MLSYLKENLQLFVILIVWLITGIYGGPVIFGLVPLTMLLMDRKEMYEELLVGYLFVLILADSASPALLFAKNLKNIYISILALIFFLRYRELYARNSLFKLFLPFLVFSVITMSFAISDSYFFTSIQKTISYALTFLVLPNIIETLFSKYHADFIKRLIFFAVVFLIIGYLLKYIMPDVAVLTGTRFRGVFGGPNGLGIFCVLLFIIFFIVDHFYNSLFTRNERLLIYLFIFLSVIGSGSRNALIAIAIFYSFQQFFGMSPFLGFLIFIVVLFVSEIISSNAVAIINALGLGSYFRVQTLEEGSGRLIAWGFAWTQIQQNFFVGRGFAYNEFYMRQHYGMLLKLNHQGGIHNSFLTFWFDQGLMGLLIYLRSYILLFIKASKRTKFAFPAMFAISFTAFFESWLVGSLSAFAFMGIFIFTILTSDEIIPQETEVIPAIAE
ncbi:MAG: O-antigen ligase family protein [Bacteroidia bacterium]|nr:O-antigen ligase family protein [Bacteroidia bacterium]